jgi:iron-sulfur cluster assembly protein
MIKELPVTITSKAISKIQSIMSAKQVPDGYGLRIGTKNTNSCGATSFMLGFDTKKTTDDVFSFEGIEVLISKKEILFLVGLTLDFEEGEEVSGFRFDK